ncbi:ComF family protein, partial [Streptomyces roseolilacinus]|uniref:ComF family protein n=1 Tax=Streptomyces roseolilacinus TaxID=66904 RepID=UPI00382CFBF9
GALPLVLVPVPSARRAVRARGHDAVRRVATAAARELRRTGVAARVTPVLRQRRAVADQAGLDARQRRENLSGALEVVPGGARLLEGARVVLVDDLMTTGASLAEAARALYAAGAVPVAGSVRGLSTAGSDDAGFGARRPEAPPGGVAARAAAPADTAADRVVPGRRNDGDSTGGPGWKHEPFGSRTHTSGRGRRLLVRRAHGPVLVGAAVVSASPKAFGINRN